MNPEGNDLNISILQITCYYYEQNSVKLHYQNLRLILRRNKIIATYWSLFKSDRQATVHNVYIVFIQESLQSVEANIF